MQRPPPFGNQTNAQISRHSRRMKKLKNAMRGHSGSISGPLPDSTGSTAGGSADADDKDGTSVSEEGRAEGGAAEVDGMMTNGRRWTLIERN